MHQISKTKGAFDLNQSHDLKTSYSGIDNSTIVELQYYFNNRWIIIQTMPNIE